MLKGPPQRGSGAKDIAMKNAELILPQSFTCFTWVYFRHYELSHMEIYDLTLSLNGLVSGKILTGKPHDLNGKIYGFRLRFSLENQSIESHSNRRLHLLHQPSRRGTTPTSASLSSIAPSPRWKHQFSTATLGSARWISPTLRAFGDANSC